MPEIVLRSASLAVFRSRGSCFIELEALGAWAQTAGAVSTPVENRPMRISAINRFMGALPRARNRAASLDAQQLHLEDQGRARGNHGARAAIAVSQMGGDDQLPLAADLHGDDTLVPALDDAPRAHRELERGAAIHRAVELGPALEPARIVHAHGVTGLGPGAPAFHQVHVAQPRRGL